MASSILAMRDQQILLDDVTMAVHSGALDADQYLQLDLCSDSRDLSRHGFALHGLIFPQTGTLHELQGQMVVFHEDDLPAGSAICEPGRALAITALQLNFGEISAGHFAIDLLAICCRRNDEGDMVEDDIRVLACLNAEIVPA